MKTSWLSKVNRMSLILFGTLMLVVMIISCDKSNDNLNKQAVAPAINNSEEIKNASKITGQILGKIHNSKEFLTLKTEAERLDYLKDMLQKKYNITTNFSYKNLVDIKAQMQEVEKYSADGGARKEASKGARKAASEFGTDYSPGELQFINYANGQTQGTSNLSGFNSVISSLAAGLRNNAYPYLTYSEALDMDTYLRYYSQYVNDWPDDLSTFEPFGSYQGGTYYDPNSGARAAAPQGACRGFGKKLCIAGWVAFFGAAGSISGPGGTIAGGAAGYLVGRCCKCGCTCDIVVCAL